MQSEDFKEINYHVKYVLEVSDPTREMMYKLGNFGPTVKGDQLRGWIIDDSDNISKTYYDAYDLKKIAEACLEVSKWLTSNTQACE